MPRKKAETITEEVKEKKVIAKRTVAKKAAPAKTAKTKNNLELSAYDINGNTEKTVDVSKEIFGEPMNALLLSQYVRVYLKNQRQGNASTKTRSEVTGSTRKIYRQKGTGKARHGNITAPIFVGGGIVGGPKPRDYSANMNKKQKRKALFISLSEKAKRGEVRVITNDILNAEAKTNIFFKLMKTMGIHDKSVLLVIPDTSKRNIIIGTRNIPSITVTNAKNINAYSVMASAHLIFVEEALKVLEAHFIRNEN